MHACALLLCACFVLLWTVSGGKNITLQLVQVLYRHGARTPVLVCPSDPNALRFLTEGLGQLTNEGKQMHFELGKFLRKRYGGSFLSARYHHNYTRVRSSNVDRTLQSAQVNLAGLYPPQDDQVWNPGLAWQPVPVHTLPADVDLVLNFLSACSNYRLEMERVLDSAYFRQLNSDYRSLYAYVSQHCGMQIDNLEALALLYDLFLVESAQGLAVPAWAGARLTPYNRTVYPHLLGAVNELAFRLLAWNNRLKRLGGGQLLAELVDNMALKTQQRLEPSSRQLLAYSGHDADIAALLGALGVYSGVPPPLASCIMVELHRDDTSGAYFVQLLYRNDTTSEPYPLSLPNCTELCPWPAFRELTADVRPASPAAECTPPAGGLPNRMQTVVIALATTLALLLVVCLLGAIVYARTRRSLPVVYSHFGNVDG